MSLDPFPNPNAGHWNGDSLEKRCTLESPGEERSQGENRKIGGSKSIRDKMDTYCRAWLSRGPRVSRKAHGTLRRKR